MPHRTKSEAQARLALGVARVSALQGDDARASLEKLKEHLAIVDALESSCGGAVPTPDATLTSDDAASS
jgi:hypothetical protein